MACLQMTASMNNIAFSGSSQQGKLIGKRGNKCDSNNYRQIAISSLLGKIFDTINLDKQKMSLDSCFTIWF